MRGLPPLPPDFITLEVEWQSDLSRCTTSWHLFAPGADHADSLYLAGLISQWFLTCVGDLLSVLPADCSASTCRASTSGIDGATVEESLAFNVGAFGSTLSANAALVMTWRTLAGPVRSRSHSFLPLSNEFLDDNKRQLRDISWAEASSAARSYATHLNSLVSPDGGTCVFAVVSRSRGGVPLPSSIWAPVDLGDASRRVGTIRRRIEARG